MEKYDKEKREQNIPEKDSTSLSNKTENSTHNNPKESDSDSDSYFDIDDERLTLIQAIKLIKNRDKKKNNITFINKKRSNPDTNITYDRLTKKLCDSFCPNYEELNKFLENCKVSEVNADSLKSNDNQKDNPNSIFDPYEFMKKNNINKTILSFEDDLCTYQPIKEIDFNYEIKEKIPKLSIPLMGPTNFFSSLTLGNESINRPEKEDYVEIWKILNTDILDKYQKKWVCYFINKVGKMPMNEVLIKDKKI